MRIVKLRNAVTVFEIGLFLFAVSVILFSACLTQQYIHLKSNDALENIQLHAVANQDKINFTGTFDRQIRCNMQHLELHFTNYDSKEVVVLGQDRMTISPAYNVPPGKSHTINLEYLLPKNISTGIWNPEFQGTWRCFNSLFWLLLWVHIPNFCFQPKLVVGESTSLYPVSMWPVVPLTDEYL